MTTARRKKLFSIAAVLVLLAGTAEIEVWWHQQHLAQREAAKAAQIAADAAQSKDYLRAQALFRDGHFDAGTIRSAVQTEFRRQAKLRVDGYFEMKTAKDRVAYLDKVIDEMIAWQSTMAMLRMSRPATRPSDAWKSQTVAWVIAQPPDDRARIAEFSVAMDQRRAQRGLPRMSAGPGSVPQN
jgi:hypothetical protein